MSTSGTYQYWPKVVNPHAIIPQMTSDTQLPPFFFGGSQVPVNLGIMTGGGFKKRFKSSLHKADSEALYGRGLHTTYEHTDRIMLPKGGKYMRR